MSQIDAHIKGLLTQHLDEIGKKREADVVAIISPILPGLEQQLRHAMDMFHCKKGSVAVILDTPGGVVEVVERMVTALRSLYDEVTVIVPDRAMSAGTIFALSADHIMMDHLSCLGPIDPQIEKDGKLIPALAYLNQYERLNKKAQEGELTTAEYALLTKLDLGELYQFEQARELSQDLLIKWLSQYKFKNWTKTKTNQTSVTEKMKVQRAKNIARLLNDPGKWHSHGRAIDMKTLQGEEIKLKIDNFEEDPDLYQVIRKYFELSKDYINREQFISFVHTKEFLSFIRTN